MGRVWRANDVVLHREVAIKELVPPPGLTHDERQEMRERSLREARAIARLNNVNVVRVFDVLRTDADPWIVMEYVPSRSLQDKLAADGPYPAVRAAEIGLGVLNALRAAHRNGVVHRDVKPGNVLIGLDGRVVLTDFGLATLPGNPDVTRTGLVLGSPAYIAPERARDGTAGPAADLWSLGATLYAAVEGSSPFARPSAIATLAALATENPPPARNAGPLKPVLNGLLRKDPAHRIDAIEAERLLQRATGRRSKLSFPMSPTMRRPGVGRERSGPPVVPGPTTGAAPVVPGPRPPVSRPQQPPAASGGTPPRGRPVPPPVTPGPPPATGRPVFAPGKASVSRPTPETPTRLDTPPVREDQIPGGGTRSRGSTGATTGRDGSAATPGPDPSSANGALAHGTRGTYGTVPGPQSPAHPGSPQPPAAQGFAPAPNPADQTSSGPPLSEAEAEARLAAASQQYLAAQEARRAARGLPPSRQRPTAEPTTVVHRTPSPPATPQSAATAPAAPQSAPAAPQRPSSAQPPLTTSPAGASVDTGATSVVRRRPEATPTDDRTAAVSSRPPTRKTPERGAGGPLADEPNTPVAQPSEAATPTKPESADKPGHPDPSTGRAATPEAKSAAPAADTAAPAAPAETAAPANRVAPTVGTESPGVESAAPAAEMDGPGVKSAGSAVEAAVEAEAKPAATTKADRAKATTASAQPAAETSTRSDADALTETSGKAAGKAGPAAATSAEPAAATSAEPVAATAADVVDAKGSSKAGTPTKDTSEATAGASSTTEAPSAGVVGSEGVTEAASQDVAGSQGGGSALAGQAQSTDEALSAKAAIDPKTADAKTTGPKATDAKTTGPETTAPTTTDAETTDAETTGAEQLGAKATGAKATETTSADEGGVGAADSSQVTSGAQAAKVPETATAGSTTAKGARAKKGRGRTAAAKAAATAGAAGSDATRTPASDSDVAQTGEQGTVAADPAKAAATKADSDGSPTAEAGGKASAPAESRPSAAAQTDATSAAASAAAELETAESKADQSDAAQTDADLSDAAQTKADQSDKAQAKAQQSNAGETKANHAESDTALADTSGAAAETEPTTHAASAAGPAVAAAATTESPTAGQTGTDQAKTKAEPGTASKPQAPADTNARLAATEVAAQINERSGAQSEISVPAARKPASAVDGKTTGKPGSAVDGKTTSGPASGADDATARTPVSNTEDKTARVTTAALANATRSDLSGLPDEPGSAKTAAGTAVIGVRPDQTSDTPSFPRSNRPAWQPLVPPTMRSRGVTIFGTTLTRKQTAIGIAILAVILLLVVVLVPLAMAGDEEPTGAPEPPAATGNVAPPAGNDGDAENKTPPATGKPSTPPATKPSAQVVVPAGWTVYNGDGFSVALPKGFKAQQRGSEVYFQDDTEHRLLIIDQTDQPKPDPVKDWEEQEEDRRGNQYRDYQRIRLGAISGYFQKAADWEFTYTTTSGNPQHAQKRGIIVNSKKAFGISYYTSPDNWDANKAVLQQIYKGFKPA